MKKHTPKNLIECDNLLCEDCVYRILMKSNEFGCDFDDCKIRTKFKPIEVVEE